MTFEAMQQLKQQRPFIAFEIELANGQVLSVSLPECFLVTKHGMVVGNPDNDRIAIFTYQDIRNLTTSDPSQA